jgi:hypothetical protein
MFGQKGDFSDFVPLLMDKQEISPKHLLDLSGNENRRKYEISRFAICLLSCDVPFSNVLIAGSDSEVKKRNGRDFKNRQKIRRDAMPDTDENL